MALQQARHISVGIRRPYTDVAGFLGDPENFPQWASGLGASFRHEGNLDWSVETPMGRMTVRFSPPNDFGIADHTLIPAAGSAMYNPLRVVRNGDGSEVTFTLFRRPGMSDAELERDAAWVAKDLAVLKTLLEG
jgi:hypothetical protein